MAMAAMAAAAPPTPTTAALQFRPAREVCGAIASSSALPQCGCGRSSSTLFGAPIRHFFLNFLGGTTVIGSNTGVAEYTSERPSNLVLSTPITNKSMLSLIKEARIEAQPPQDQKLKLRVDFSGKDTQRAFDTVVRGLAKNAPPVPGFRKAKGGKTSIVPTSVLLNMMGITRVRKFVIEEIVRTTLVEYVEKEGIKAKKNLVTDQNAEELDAIFEPGKDFGFDATLELEDDAAETAEAEPETTDSEVVAA